MDYPLLSLLNNGNSEYRLCSTKSLDSESTTQGLPRTKKACGYSRFSYFPPLTLYTFFTWIQKGPYCKSDKILNMNHFSPQLAENSAHVLSQLC